MNKEILVKLTFDNRQIEYLAENLGHELTLALKSSNKEKEEHCPICCKWNLENAK